MPNAAFGRWLGSGRHQVPIAREASPARPQTSVVRSTALGASRGRSDSAIGINLATTAATRCDYAAGVSNRGCDATGIEIDSLDSSGIDAFCNLSASVASSYTIDVNWPA